ncbi:MAG TPA: sugar ABC transporter permease, partial [Kaistia sp.]|nr:sugar ABC transporter permease [Kaistia sp.]
MHTKSRDNWVAAAFVAPFVIAYLVLFLYPTVRMVILTFTDAPLIGAGKWIGFKNYQRLFNDKAYLSAVWNTGYFVLLTVIPNTLLGLVFAMMVNRQKGYVQSFILAAFFLPYILPVSVVYRIWEWMMDYQFGIAQHALDAFYGQRVAVFRDKIWAMPMMAFVTIWWTIGFNVLLFIAGLRNISQDMYDASALDGAKRWKQFRYITWPLIWPVTALVLTIQLILQLKIFDQIYLLTLGGNVNNTMVLVQYIYKQAFQLNKGGYGATVAFSLFAII